MIFEGSRSITRQSSNCLALFRSRAIGDRFLIPKKPLFDDSST
jgi:hypothetical protein